MGILDTTLIACVHHRRTPPFEESMRKLHTAGLHHIWILESGDNRWGKYQGPHSKWHDLGGPAPHALGLAELAKMHLPGEIRRLLLIDSDCFIIDPNDTVEYLETFANEQYDLACLSAFRYPQQGDSIIVEQDLAEFHGKCIPGGIAYSIFNRDTVWNHLLSPMTQFFIHDKQPGFEIDGKRCRNFWESFVRLNPKFGVHRMDEATAHPAYRTARGKSRNIGGYSQFEQEKWIHVGNLTASYYAVEGSISGKKEPLGDIRKGYFAKYFPDKYKVKEPHRSRYIQKWDAFTWGKL